MKVVFRADASTEIGTGHLMRCIALSQALKRRGTLSVFVTRTEGGALLERLRRDVSDIVLLDAAEVGTDAAFTASVARSRGAEWIVVDGYEFGSDYSRSLSASGHRVLRIDDMGRGEFECDVVLNQNLHALVVNYAADERTRLLLGPEYALLREEFVEDVPINVRRASKDNARILVTVGGADPENCTLKILDALSSLSMVGAEIRVIGGAAFANGEALRARAGVMKMPTEVLIGVDNMVEQMLWADRCVTAGGSTCWEYCRLGVPMAVGVIAENQVAVARSIQRHGLGIDLGWFTTESTESLRRRLSFWLSDVVRLRKAAEEASSLVDGRGADRVAEILLVAAPLVPTGSET